MDGEPILKKGFYPTYTLVSPDGRWLAYQSNESDQIEIYVRSFPDVNEGKWKVSTSGGMLHRWSPDGRELYYWTGDALMVAAVESELTFDAGTPEVLLQRRPLYSNTMSSWGISWDIHPDGKRFLMIKQAETTGDETTEKIPRKINIVVNWFEELKDRAPVE